MTCDPLDFIDPNKATPEALLDALIHITHQLKHYSGWKERITSSLNTHLELGRIEAITDFDGFRFSFNPGRKSYDYPDSVTALEAQLMEAKEVAVSTGAAIARLGKPFWSVRELSTASTSH